MSIKIGTYSFDEPYTSTDELEDKSGVYAILCKENGEYTLIDVGESREVKTRVENHDRQDCWSQHCQGELVVSVYYTPNKQKVGRTEIEQEIRDEYDPSCGKI